MNDVIADVLISAANTMWRREPTLGSYTRDTYQTEMNLAFHYTSTLRYWLPWFDCDFDIAKKPMARERPDIVFHRRGGHSANFLVLEVKRERFRRDVPGDVAQIVDRWFTPPLNYFYGACVILDESIQRTEVQLISRGSPPSVSVYRSIDGRPPVRIPRLSEDRLGDMCSRVDRLASSSLEDQPRLRTDLENAMSALWRPPQV